MALLPLEVRSRGRWESAATRAVHTHRKRYRPVLGAETPDEEVVGLLVDEVGRAGVRELSLNRLPAGDPATGALLAALRHGGYAVASLERSCDYLTRVEGGWEGHRRRRFTAYERSVRRLVKRCQPWELRLEEYGGRSGAPMATGFGLYESLHERSWKGSLKPAWRREYLALLRRAEQLGWCRIYVLRVAGIPAAPRSGSASGRWPASLRWSTTGAWPRSAPGRSSSGGPRSGPSPSRLPACSTIFPATTRRRTGSPPTGRRC